MSGTTIHQFTTNLITELSEFYPEQEIRQFSKLMLEHLLQVSTTHLLMMNSERLSEQHVQDLERMSNQLKKHIPIQYILGETEFYGLKFEVNPNVLIPRPETEELVNWIIKDYGVQFNNLLDIGTGSGCIALSLKANMPETHITAWDISAKAIQTARQNATHLDLNVNFEEVDVLSHQGDHRCFDCIVSNPPYVRELEKKMMETNVLDHEPHTALFVSDTDPLIFYRTIAKLGLQMLHEKGVLFFEINEYLEKEMIEMLSQLGYTQIESRQDINGRPRMMKANRP